MCRKLFFIAIILNVLWSQAKAQPYGNEWVAFVQGQQYSTQQYFRISVWREGVYRLSYADLQSGGVPVSTWFSTDRYQLYHEGKEQFIRVFDQNLDNLFGPGDYLEFYGKSNDGSTDVAVYEDPAYQPNPYVSMFNDTAAYFLTYSPFSSSNRRMPVVNETNYSSYTPLSWFWKEDVKVYSAEYNIGPRDYNDVADNSYMKGEGFLSAKIDKNAPFNINFNVRHYQPSSAGAILDAVVMGANANAHPYRFSSGSTLILDTTFAAYELVHHTMSVPNLPLNGNHVFQFAPQNDPTFPGNQNYMQIAYASLRYPRSFDFAGESLPLHLNVSGPSSYVLLECNSVNASNPSLYVVSGDTVKRILGNFTGGIFRAIAPLNGAETRFFMLDETQVFSSSSDVLINSVNNDPDPAVFARFPDYRNAQVQDGMVIVSNRSIWSGATAYADYRQQHGLNVLLADVDQLYDQFGYGVRKSPLAIRRFADFLLDQISPAPKHLLLIGKSVLSCNARSGLGYAKNLVPTFGEPASDQMFTAKLNTPVFAQELSTGRIAAQNDADVLVYLDKVTAFENAQSAPPAPWMKNILHFGGGTDISEQNYLSSKLAVYKQVIEDTLFGGNVTTILKSSTAPIQLNLSQYIQQLIDSGCTMMTFYGHAAGTSFDISTDDPEFYNNKGRYPLVLAQSCFVGDIHTTSRLLNERFVLTPDKGSIGFIAVPEKGIIQPLDDYSSRFHENLFRDNYGRTIGESMKKTVEEIILPDFDRKSVCMNMTLHGDPALVLNAFDKADYVVEDAGIFTEPAILSTDVDSFLLKVVVANIGKNVSDSIFVLASRTFPGGLKKDTIFRTRYISFKDTVSVKLPLDALLAPGLNSVEVTVDVYDEIPEVDDINNNVANFQFQVQSADINPVYPPEFAIIPSGNVVLKASTATLFSGPRNYRFELDTSSSFNSPVKIAGTVTNAFGIVSWTLPASIDSNIVYYWRVANDSILDPDSVISSRFQWKKSSFMYKPGITGWSQAHYFQFSKSGLSNVHFVDSLRITDFVNSNYSLVMTHEESRPSYEINGVNMDYGACFPITQLAVAVIDSIDFENPWTADSCIRYYGNYNYYLCYNDDGCAFRTRPDRYFLFDVSTQTGINSMINMINNVVPDGDYLLSWPSFTAPFDTLTQLKSAFTALGVPQYNALQTGDKYLLFMKKGDPASVIFEQGKYPDSLLRIDYLLSRNWDKGYVSSTEIGPALSWDALYWEYRNIEPQSSPDYIYLQVFGIATTGQEVLLLSTVFSPGGPTDLSFIDAAQYPKLRLRAYVEDTQNRTPPQLESWQVYYQPVPEGAVNPQYFSLYNDTVQEGDNVRFRMAFENISSVKMDTLLVDYFVYDAGNTRRNILSRRLGRDLPPGDTVMCEVEFNSMTLRGKNSLWMEVNPRMDQPEQYHFNNYASTGFVVNPDITNPLLDVTFDGVYILNRDIVSARPQIQIKLKDENRFIALNDTADFRVILRSPSGNLEYLHFEPAPGTSAQPGLLSWLPASLPNNSFRIDYNPVLSEDGIYELSVQATDVSGNLSGSNDYKIQFEVINKSTVTEVVNYPNPFSSATRFVFTLTGSEIPSDIRIRIMTVSGKIVREIMRDELGPVRIGRNVTEYAWDGKDEFGDQLANGVYLYQVYMGINGAEIEKRSGGADPYFRKGWGKMYLMR